ncbi:MAG: SH3 domain-containing protein [Nitrospinota bacterium]
METARRWRPICLAFLLGGLLGAGAWSSWSGGSTHHAANGRPARVAGASRLNLREGPGTDARIIAVLERGTDLCVLGQTGEWRWVRQGDLVGWAHGAYLASRPGRCD